MHDLLPARTGRRGPARARESRLAVPGHARRPRGLHPGHHHPLRHDRHQSSASGSDLALVVPIRDRSAVGYDPALVTTEQPRLIK